MTRVGVRSFLGALVLGLLVPAAQAGGVMKISQIRTDMSYGDAAWWVFPNGRTMLIDGGNNFDVNPTPVGSVANPPVKLTDFIDAAIGNGGTIWYMAMSHAHGDHLGGLSSWAIPRYVVMRYYSSFPENDSTAESLSTTGYSYLTAALNTEFSAPYTANSNCYEIVATGSSATTAKVSGPATNLGPMPGGWDPTVDALVISGEEMSANAGPNSNSVSFHVWYGSSTVETGGDMTGQGSSEGDLEGTALVNFGAARLNKNVTLWKMHHHGASTSNSAAWISAITPNDPLTRYSYVCEGDTDTAKGTNLSAAAITNNVASQRTLYRTALDGPARFTTIGDGQWSAVRRYVYAEGGTTNHASAGAPPGISPAFSPTAPAAVVSSANVNLSWTAPGGVATVVYYVYRATAAGGFPANPFTAGEDPPESFWRTGSVPGVYRRIAQVASPGTTYQDAPGNGLFHYRIKAVSGSYYESEYSTEFTTDTVAPSSPTALAVASGGSDALGAYLNLTWTANSEGDLWDYRVYRATYTGAPVAPPTNMTRIAMPGTTHRDGGLGNGTTYYYKLTSRDTSLNESPGSSEVNGNFRDSAAPAAPTGLGLADVPGDQGKALSLAWVANSEGDLKDYRVYRSTNAGVAIGSTWTVHVATLAAPGTTHQDAGLSPNATYYYRLSARDGVLNESGLSTESGTYPVDNLAPVTPSALGVSDPGTTVLNFSWAANTETDLKDYRIHRSTNAGVVIGGTQTVVLAAIAAPGTTHQDGGLTAGSRYNYRLTARDTSLNESGGASEVSGIPGPPAAPSGLAISSVVATGQRLNLTWTANTEGDLKDYRVYRSTNAGVTAGSTWTVHVATIVAPGTTHQDAGLANGATFYYRLSARDTSLNESGLSAEISGVPQDTTPPAAPSVLLALDPATGQRLNLSWTANTEGDLKDYRIRRSTGTGITLGTAVLATVAGTTHQDAGLTNGPTYYYRLTARDVTLNESGLSVEISGLPSDLTPPAAPAGLVAIDSGTTVENLSWTADTEVDLKDYRIHRSTNAGVIVGGTQTVVLVVIAAPGTTHQDGGLTLGQRYYFRLTARDVTLNESAGSAEVLAVPGPPAAPAGLGVEDVPGDLGTALRLSWAANVEGDLKNYWVYRSTNAGVTVASTWTVHLATVAAPGTTHQDAALSNGVTYYYRLSARDTVQNESGLSAEAGASPFSNAAGTQPTGMPPPAPPPTVTVSVVIAAASGGAASLQAALEPGKQTTISGSVLTLASTGAVAGNTIEVKIVNIVGTAAPGLLAGAPGAAFELPRVSTVVAAGGAWSMKTPSLPDGEYQIQLRQVNQAGPSAWAPDPPFSVKVDAVPDVLAVVPAGPNPFRPGAGVSLALGFELAEAAVVSVTIHTEDGAIVATLIDGQTLSAGRYTRSPAGSSAMVWDGRTDAGKPAASGVYFCRIKIGDRLFTRKILLIR